MNHDTLRPLSARPLALLLFALAFLPLGPGCSDPPRLAKGTYRLPFIDGTQVGVTNSFFNHNGEYDLSKIGASRGFLAAAAPGWVRIIEDTNAEPTSSNNYLWIEHPYPYCQPAGVDWPGKPADYDATCLPCDLTYCNEWSKYSHPATGSVRTAGLVLVDGLYALGAGLTEDDWVDAGDYLGIEDDVGMADGIHVHWEVVILNPNDPIDGGGWSKDWTGGAWIYSPNLMPYVCTGPEGDTSPTPYLLYEGDAYDAQPCPEEFSVRQVQEREFAEELIRQLADAKHPAEAPGKDLSAETRERAMAEIPEDLQAAAEPDKR